MTIRRDAGSCSGLVRGTELEAAWAACADLFCDAVKRESRVTYEEFARELAFCVLGGFGVSYEHALSATARVMALDPFGTDWQASALHDRLIWELSQPRYEPRRVDGTLRRFRFPQRKAGLLVMARRWLLEQGDVVGVLMTLESDCERRRFMRQCPGIGSKTASWLLRNVGLASELAILDVHVVTAMQAAGRIGSVKLPRDYEFAEQAFLAWCHELRASVGAFDLFVWEWQRGTLWGPT